jgi:hypothetical protein
MPFADRQRPNTRVLALDFGGLGQFRIRVVRSFRDVFALWGDFWMSGRTGGAQLPLILSQLDCNEGPLSCHRMRVVRQENEERLLCFQFAEILFRATERGCGVGWDECLSQ